MGTSSPTGSGEVCVDVGGGADWCGACVSKPMERGHEGRSRRLKGRALAAGCRPTGPDVALVAPEEHAVPRQRQGAEGRQHESQGAAPKAARDRHHDAEVVHPHHDRNGDREDGQRQSQVAAERHLLDRLEVRTAAPNPESASGMHGRGSYETRQRLARGGSGRWRHCAATPTPRVGPCLTSVLCYRGWVVRPVRPQTSTAAQRQAAHW